MNIHVLSRHTDDAFTDATRRFIRWPACGRCGTTRIGGTCSVATDSGFAPGWLRPGIMLALQDLSRRSSAARLNRLETS